MLTQATLRARLHYSVITGEFYWLKSKGRVKAGDVAGCLNSGGYIYIQINSKPYLAHRLAWFWVTGEWPTNEIDHKSGIRDANYWLNLREATNSQNACNTRLCSINTSGYKGVCWNKARKKWQANIKLSNKTKHLGYFDDINLAYAARLKAQQELHGDFARI